jgi:acyl-CoA synthetase (AMP-forming)/AMP-acid ligase II
VRSGCAVALGYIPPGGEGEELLILAERASGSDSADDPALIEQIRVAVIERTAVRPHAVHVLEAGTLPRTSSGKMRRAEALRRFVAGELVPPAWVNGLTLATEVVKSAMAFARSRLR